MYQEHRAFEVVPPETIIWQYMPLSKFICLLRKKELYFNRIDNFSDNTECTLTAIDEKVFRYSEETKLYWERERKRHFISCWVESDYELALMWDTYGKGGVTIKTTVGSLIDSLAIDSDHIQYLARVNYIDEQSDSSQEAGTAINVLKIPMTKRKYYEQEREIRLLYTRNEIDDQTGFSFPVDLDCLIDEVVVFPNAPQYFLDVVNNELVNAGILSTTHISII